LRIEAADAHTTAIGVAQTLEDLDSSGFASAIWAEEPENFALFDGETNSPDGFHIAVAFYKIFDLENGSSHGESMACR
jgi:hypothetical protein